MIGARNFPCKSCGAEIEFNPEAQALKCPHCGHEERIPRTKEEIQNYAFNDRLVRPKQGGTGLGGRQLRCARCGASFTVLDTTIATRCAYCGQAALVPEDEIAKDRIAPVGVIPFEVSLAQAREAFVKWVRGLWFAPGSLTRDGLDEKLRGVYRPYWTFDAFTSNHFSGERGDHYTTTETYTDSEGRTATRHVQHTRWTYVSGEFTRFFEDVLVDAGREMAFDTRFRMRDVTPFDESYLSGFGAETYSIEPEAGWARAKERISSELLEDSRRRIGGDEQRGVRVATAYSQVQFRLLLLPIYAGLFEYRGKRFPVQVNGETGEVRGKRPYSAWKIFFAVLAALAAAAGLLFLWSQTQ